MEHALKENERADHPPRGRTELARMVKADKGGLSRMLDTDQKTYKYAKQISELLNIPYAQVDNPALTDGEGAAKPADQLDVYVARVRALPEPKQRKYLRWFEVSLEDDE